MPPSSSPSRRSLLARSPQTFDDRVHWAVSARLLVRQQLERTHEILARTLWRVCSGLQYRPQHAAHHHLHCFPVPRRDPPDVVFTRISVAMRAHVRQCDTSPVLQLARRSASRSPCSSINADQSSDQPALIASRTIVQVLALPQQSQLFFSVAVHVATLYPNPLPPKLLSTCSARSSSWPRDSAKYFLGTACTRTSRQLASRSLLSD